VFDASILPSRVVDPRRKVPDLNCEVQDLLLEVVDLKQEVPDLRSGGIPPVPNLTPGHDLIGCSETRTVGARSVRAL